MDTSRTEKLIDVEHLKSKKVIIVGIGGVGGYVCEMLARAGVENIKIVDFDVVAKSNCNRQIIALNSTIGRYKVDVMKERLLDINENIKVETVKDRLTKDNCDKIINQCDFCIDAIDSVIDKKELIIYCIEHNISIISSMGAGNRFDIPNYQIMDIYETSYDKLAKALRKLLKGKVKKLPVVCSVEEPIITTNIVGSISYQPAMCGCVLGSYVINKFLKEKENENN